MKTCLSFLLLFLFGCGNGNPLSIGSLSGRWEGDYGAFILFGESTNTYAANGGALYSSGYYFTGDGMMAFYKTTETILFKAEIGESVLTLQEIDDSAVISIVQIDPDTVSIQNIPKMLNGLSKEPLPLTALDSETYVYRKQ